MGAMNEFKVLDPNGHARTSWDTRNPEEVERARRIFNNPMNRGYRAFRMDASAGTSVPKRARLSRKTRKRFWFPRFVWAEGSS